MKFKVYVYDGFDMETAFLGEADTIEAAAQIARDKGMKLREHYFWDIDSVDVVDEHGNIVKKFGVGS